MTTRPRTPARHGRLLSSALIMLAILRAPVPPSCAAQPGAGRLFQVGPTHATRTLQDVAGTLMPGDVVEVDGGEPLPGGVVFDRDGTADQPITIRGRTLAGRRPVIVGGRDGIECGGNHYLLEGLEITAAGRRGVNHRAHGIVIRDCVIRDCPNGVMSSDRASGDLTVEYCEVFGCGRDQGDHQFYVATDEERHPGAEFLLRFCWIHDGAGGNDVKSRAERTTVYANWIADGVYHTLDLVGADPAAGVRPDRAREDGEVVGNVLIASRFGRNVRIGGDGTGESDGRYRFLNNTFVHRCSRPESQVQARFGVESVEMHNNLFVATAAVQSGGAVFDDARAAWVGGVRRVGGTANWVQRSARGVPAEWTRTIIGADPILVGLDVGRLRPAPGSPLVAAGVLEPTSLPGMAFPRPTAAAHHPPEARLLPPGTAERRDDIPPTIGGFSGK